MVSIILAIAIICSCSHSPKKRYPKTTLKICNKLYVQLYRDVATGAYGGDIISDYLTDSLNFRIYIGYYNDNEGYYRYECSGDSILVEKVKTFEDSKPIVTERRGYSITELKKSKNFK